MKAIVLLLACIIAFTASQTFDVTSGNAAFTVTTALKTSHPYVGQGFSVGFVINGTQGATIIMSVGFTYTFTVNSACNHPFFITTDSSGQFSIGEVNAGVVSAIPSYQQVCNGGTPGILTFSPTVAFVGRDLFYQCRTHSKMGYKIIVRNQTICNKYSRRLSLTNQALVFTVVNATFHQAIQPGSQIVSYFNGQEPPASTDYAGNQGLAAQLINSLVRFFRDPLGCTDGTIANYAGPSNMATVHQNMPIGNNEFNAFNNIVLGVMAGVGVESFDLRVVNATLNTLKPQICNELDCRQSICDRYSDILGVSNVGLMTAIVTATFGKITQANTITVPFFNGTVPPGSTNFLTNSAALTNLATNLVTFFGRDLGCSDPGFPTYTGEPNMTLVHRNMPIGKAVFEFFNQKLIEVLIESGVSALDQGAVATYLETHRRAICSGLDCFGTQSGINFVLDVVPKSNHPWTDGFPSGYKVDGVQGRTVALQVGTTYRFTNLGTCQHPLYISTSDQGSGAGAVTLGVNYPGDNAFATCNGAFLDFTPQASQNGQTLYYQCQNHARMGGPLLIGTQPPPATTGGTAPQTFCQKYVTATGLTALQIVSTVVNNTVVLLTATGSIARPYFDGTQPQGSTNFLASPIRFQRLFTNLVTFFGAGLGCTDGTIGIYEGQPDMRVTHENMGITPPVFDFFVDTVVNVMGGIGVDPGDQAAARSLLNSFRGSICLANECFPTTAVATTGDEGGAAGYLMPTFFLAIIALFALL